MKDTVSCNILIEKCALLDEDMNVSYNHWIAIQNGEIAAIGSGIPTYNGSQHLDGENKLFMPGLADGHTHVCQQLLRGAILDELPMIWTRIMLPYESTLTEELAEISAQLACLEMIKSGTTAFADAGGRFMHKAAEAAIASGLRAVLTYSSIDSGNAPPTMKGTTDEVLERGIQFHQDYNGAGDGRISVSFSLRALLSCSEALIVRTAEAATKLDTGIHAHMSEYPGEVTACLEAHKLRPFEYLNTLGVLGSRFLSAHSILLSDAEIELARIHNVKVVHCPFSNCGKGVPHTPRLLERGICVGLGTDGAAHGGLSLWNEMKIFRSIMNAYRGVPMADPIIMPAKTILRMATQGSSCAMGLEKTGVLKPGFKADMISIDINQPHILPSANLTNTLLETVGAGDVQDMIVNGKLIMKDRNVLTLDESGILERAKSIMQKQIDCA